MSKQMTVDLIDIKGNPGKRSVRDGYVAEFVVDGDHCVASGVPVDIAEKAVLAFPGRFSIDNRSMGLTPDALLEVGRLAGVAVETGEPQECNIQMGDGSLKINIVRLNEEGETAEALPSTEEEPADEEPEGEEETPEPAKAPEVSPAAQRLIDANNIDAGLLKGSGAGGKILKADVEKYLA